MDNEFFQLPAAMRAVWKDEQGLTKNQRRLIASAIEGIELEDGPTDEDQLLGTQLALMACRLLQTAVRDDSLEHWLTKEAMDYPLALQRYTYLVAKYFHRYEQSMVFDMVWSRFIENLVIFIEDSKSHVATLNYDTLLYEPFNDVQNVNGRTIKLCRGFSGTLLDGYTKGLGFSEKNLSRQRPLYQSFYMHLHGSPLFVDDANGIPRKIGRHQLNGEYGDIRSHIVLTNGALKPRVIQGSSVLQMYWDHLPQAIAESDEVIIFGYSGLDDHLNRMIRDNIETRHIQVIERNHPGVDRDVYWSSRLGPTSRVSQYENILEFTNW